MGVKVDLRKDHQRPIPGPGESMALALRAGRHAARFSARGMSSLAVAGQAASVQLDQEGLAELPKTLLIHKRGEDQLVREGAQARTAAGGEIPPPE